MEKKAPVSANRRNLLVGGLMLVALLVFLDPLQVFAPKPAPARREFSEPELAAQAPRFLADARPAVGAVRKLFDTRRVVLVGSHFLIREHLDFGVALARSLAGGPVRLVGCEFLLASDQPAIDRLVGAADWDEALARQVLFNWQALCGYRENLDLLRTVWQLNRDRAAGDPGFRLIGLNVAQDLTAVRRPADLENPEIMRRIFAGGVPDEFMAGRVRDALADPAGGGKILVITQLASALGSWQDESYTADMAKRGFPGQRRLGNLLSAALPPGQVATVLLSGPWNYRPSRTGTAWPADGLVDRLIAARGAQEPAGGPEYPLAWELAAASLGEVRCRINDFAAGKGAGKGVGNGAGSASPRLRDLGDVLVVFGPVSALHAVSPVPDFITAANLGAAVRTLPGGRDPASVKVAQLNDSIRKVSTDMQAQLDSFH